MRTNIVIEDEIGKKYHKLTITSVIGRFANSMIKVLAICECGVEKEYYLGNLRKPNHTTSCGCEKKRIILVCNKTHGFSKNHPLYKVWSTMKERCYNKNSENYLNYGGKGVTVCKEWRENFKSYHDWAIANGWRKGLNIDKDKSGGNIYSPETCEVMTSKENQNNRRDNIVVNYKGERLTLKQAADKYNVKYSVVWARYVELGWDIKESIEKPLKKFNTKPGKINYKCQNQHYPHLPIR